MANMGKMPIFERGDIAAAFALLTRLPGFSGAPIERGARAAWAYPFVGAAMGLGAGVTGALALWLGLAPAFAAGLALVAGIMATGALHEDGLADTADGLWGGWDPERRLEIMKDSQIGSYGVIALGLSLILRWAALSALFAAGGAIWALIGAGALSRAGMILPMATLPHARDGGLARRTGQVEADTAWLAVGVAAVIALLALGFGAIWAAIVVLALAFVLRALARAKLGGQTGDVLGATQQVCEITVLMILASAI